MHQRESKANLFVVKYSILATEQYVFNISTYSISHMYPRHSS